MVETGIKMLSKNLSNFGFFFGVPAMAALEAASSFISSSSSPSLSKFPSCPKLSPIVFLRNATTIPLPSLKIPPCTLPVLSTSATKKSERFEISCSAVEEIAVEEESEENTDQPIPKRKLFVQNFSWSLTVDDIKSLFAECGTVAEVEIIKQKNGKSRGYAFVTMDSVEEAQAVIDKFDSRELNGRIVRVQYAKRLKRPPTEPPSPPAAHYAGEAHHKLYVGNLAWKVRSSHLREAFAANFNPTGVKVVFQTPSGSSAGYGFVSFATKEETKAALSAMNGKEIMGRPLRLKLGVQNTEESADGKAQKEISEEPEPS